MPGAVLSTLLALSPAGSSTGHPEVALLFPGGAAEMGMSAGELIHRGALCEVGVGSAADQSEDKTSI